MNSKGLTSFCGEIYSSFIQDKSNWRFMQVEFDSNSHYENNFPDFSNLKNKSGSHLATLYHSMWISGRFS